jgi:hypothetical protein
VSALRGRKKVLKKGHIAAIAIGAFLVAIMSAYLCFVYVLRRFCWTHSPEVCWISSSLHHLFCTLLLPTSCVFRREDDLKGRPVTPAKHERCSLFPCLLLTFPVSCPGMSLIHASCSDACRLDPSCYLDFLRLDMPIDSVDSDTQSPTSCLFAQWHTCVVL